MAEAVSGASERTAGAPDCLGPDDWCRCLRSAAQWLGLHAEQINALNVFPVPDADTGTNMYLTLEAAAEACAAGKGSQSLGDRAEWAARGALLAARGNSGVILAQALIGMAEVFDGFACADGSTLAHAMRKAAQASYDVMLQPVEGTILTVMRRAADAAERAAQGGADVQGVLRAALEAAGDAVAETPRLLDVLAEAGVVDAGGEGFRIALEGMIYGLEGRPLPEPQPAHAPHRSTLEMPPDRNGRGFCITVTLRAVRSSGVELREELAKLGESVVVIADPSLVKVHVHSDDPSEVLQWAAQKGEVQEVKVDRILERIGPVSPRSRDLGSRVSVVAVTEGEGFTELFSRLGARVVDAGELSPTVEDLLRAIEGSPAPVVVVLPNDPNVLVTAREAGKLSTKKVEVMDTRTLQEGLAAVVAFSPDVPLEQNLSNMRASARRVTSIRVAQAVKDGWAAGTRVRAGQFMAVISGDGVGVGATLREAVARAVGLLADRDFSLVSVYYGDRAEPDELKEVVEGLRAMLPSSDVEVAWGGQRRSILLISLES